MPELQTDVSQQVKPVRLGRPFRNASARARTRQGALTSPQMRILSDSGIPAICKSTLIDQAVGGLSFKILNPQGEEDAQTEFHTMLVENANDGEGATPFFERFCDDVLSTVQGGYFEAFTNDDGVPLALYNVDAITIAPTFEVDTPWAQFIDNEEPVRFPFRNMAHAYWLPTVKFGANIYNKTPIQMIYTYLCILAASDDWNLDLLADPFPASVLALAGATQEEAEAFKSSWDEAISGGRLQDIAVIFGLDLKQATQLKLTRPPTDMAFEITNHWYSSLVAASYQMSIMDISLLTKVSTKAAADTQQQISAQQGQRKLRKITSEAMEKWVLPQGYQWKWIIPKPDDERTQANALESRSRGIFYLVQAYGPDRGDQMAREIGLIPSTEVRTGPEMLHSENRVKKLLTKADLNGYISSKDWEFIQSSMGTWARTPPPSLYGQELYDVIAEIYEEELMAALEIWHMQVEEDPEDEDKKKLAAILFLARYREAFTRAAHRSYLAGKQRDASSLEEAIAIAAIAFTVVELLKIQEMIDEDESFFQKFSEELAIQGEDYTQADWRTSLYIATPRKFYLEGIVAMVDPDADLIVIIPGDPPTGHCDTCPPRWGEYTFEQYAKLGGPPPNWCQGHNSCHCDIEVLRGRKRSI